MSTKSLLARISKHDSHHIELDTRFFLLAEKRGFGVEFKLSSIRVLDIRLH